MATDSLVRTWQLIHTDLVPGLVRWVIYLFRRLQEEVERLIYTVDEWLRFRPGDSRLSLYCQARLRAGVVLRHLSLSRDLQSVRRADVQSHQAFSRGDGDGQAHPADLSRIVHAFQRPLEPVLGKALGGTVAATAIFLLPGLAGFLVWEFKENWRLYRANQAPTLRPEIVGHHGETVLRLMRPGLHSGTLPKLYARLRHGRGRSPRKQYEALHHLRDRLRQFVERNLFAILAGSKSWGDARP